MNQNKMALMAELQELTQELENMKIKYEAEGNKANEDGDINIEEQKILDELKSEINLLNKEVDLIKAAIQPMEIPQVTQQITANSDETIFPGEEVNIGLIDGDEQSNVSTNISISEDEFSIDTTITEGDEQIGIHLDSNGGAGVTGETEVSKGTKVKAEISTDQIMLGIEKEWKFPDYNIECPIFAISGFSCKIGFGLNGKMSIELSGSRDNKTAIVKAGVSATAEADGEIYLAGDIAEVLRLKTSLTLSPTITASGYACYDTANEERYLDFTGLDAKLFGQGSITLSPTPLMMEIVGHFGYSEADVTWILAQSPKYELLVFDGPGYCKGEIVGEWSLPTEGKDIITLQEKLEGVKDRMLELYHYLEDKYKMLEDGVIAAYEGTIDLIDSTTEALAIELGLVKTQKVKFKNNIKDIYENQLFETTFKKVIRQKKHIEAMRGMSETEEALYLSQQVASIIKTDPKVKEISAMIEEGELTEAGEGIEQLNTNLSLKIDKSKTEAEADFGDKLDIVVTLESDQLFKDGKIRAGLYCDQKLMSGEVIQTIKIEEGITQLEFELQVPPKGHYPDSDTSSWHISVKLDPLGELQDIEDKINITVYASENDDTNETDNNEPVFTGGNWELKIKTDASTYDIGTAKRDTMDVTLYLNAKFPDLLPLVKVEVKCDGQTVVEAEQCNVKVQGGSNNKIELSNILMPGIEESANYNTTAEGGKWTVEAFAVLSQNALGMSGTSEVDLSNKVVITVE